jgi:hypothetical protein
MCSKAEDWLNWQADPVNLGFWYVIDSSGRYSYRKMHQNY